jgi:hypothetical protein
MAQISHILSKVKTGPDSIILPVSVQRTPSPLVTLKSQILVADPPLCPSDDFQQVIDRHQFDFQRQTAYPEPHPMVIRDNLHWHSSTNKMNHGSTKHLLQTIARRVPESAHGPLYPIPDIDDKHSEAMSCLVLLVEASNVPIAAATALASHRMS